MNKSGRFQPAAAVPPQPLPLEWLFTKQPSLVDASLMGSSLSPERRPSLQSVAKLNDNLDSLRWPSERSKVLKKKKRRRSAPPTNSCNPHPPSPGRELAGRELAGRELVGRELVGQKPSKPTPSTTPRSPPRSPSRISLFERGPTSPRRPRLSLFGNALARLDSRGELSSDSDGETRSGASTTGTKVSEGSTVAQSSEGGRVGLDRIEVLENFLSSSVVSSLSQLDASTTLLFRSSMPIRVEAMHSLEHAALRVADPQRPSVLLYRCPLCDERFEKPKRWRQLFEHYVETHWRTRRYLGRFVCFPCKQVHDFNVTRKLVAFAPEQPNEGGRNLRRSKTIADLLLLNPHDQTLELIISRNLTNMPEHFHCPSNICAFVCSEFPDMQAHCSSSHRNSQMDPQRTPKDPAALHAPLLNTRAIDILPLRKEDEPTEDPSEITQRIPLLSPTNSPSPDTSSPKFSLFNFETPPSAPSPSACETFHSLIGSPPLRRKRRHVDDELTPSSCLAVEKSQEPSTEETVKRRVRFSEHVYQVTYDKERSRVEKCGSSLGPGIEVDTSEPFVSPRIHTFFDDSEIDLSGVVVPGADDEDVLLPFKRRKVEGNAVNWGRKKRSET